MILRAAKPGNVSTVLGTSAEGGDAAKSAAGTKSVALWSFSRPTGSEAAAGKNPVSHVGKSYTLLTMNWRLKST